MAPGASVGDRYRLGELVGEGGMGQVFRAEQMALGRTVAIKCLRRSLAQNPSMLLRFHQEARAASLLSHPNLVGVIDFGVAEAIGPYLVMEYVPGANLGQIIAREGPLALGRAVRLVAEILSALEVAHDAGIVHADIKSENVLVQPMDRGGERVKIIDFGLARLRRSSDLDEDDMVSGTPEYVAPEVIGGRVPTPAADIYAVGIILFEILTGTTPFRGGSVAEILARHLRDAVLPPSLCRPDRLIPPALEQVVLRALAKDPRARFADATSFRLALVASTSGIDLDELCWVPTRAGEAPCGSDVPTQSWAPEEEPVAPGPRRLARGSLPPAPSVPRPVGPTPALYQALACAIARGSADDIADAYLALARALAGAGRVATAIGELEEAVDVVSAGRGPRPGDACPAVSRLLAALSGAHALAGDHDAARRAAIQSHRLASCAA